ncbi:citramalate synthase [candidate division KSB1 bacterium]|jgi:2-isopropylmalate synthase|nr:citramalate synthase [candidate division KSB1 bacterium]
MKLDYLEIYDTTLRDGAQSEGISFSVDDKIKIAKKLDDFGVDFIEGGWPGSNPKDMEFFEQAAEIEWKNARIAAFGSTRRVKSQVFEDTNIRLLLAAKTPVVTIFGKSWNLHVTEGLRTTLEKNLELIHDSIDYLKQHDKMVIYDAEHYFDGYKANPEYALQTLQTAVEAGAERIVLCDTNGGTLVHELLEIIEASLALDLGVPFGIHAHNDSDVAVANTVAAVNRGLNHVQGTINGYGERCGNANLCSVIANVALKCDTKVKEKVNLSSLTNLSRYVSELANLAHREEAPYVGNSAFAHKGGIHVSAIRRNRQTYEHIDPSLIGNHQRVLVSDQSGQSNILQKAEEMGIDLSGNGHDVKNIVHHLKEMEHLGYQFEGADGSLQVLFMKATGQYKPFFELLSARVLIDKREDDSIESEAVLKIRVNNIVEHTAAEGHGPVDALDKALRKALEPFYPTMKSLHLVDYKVRVLNSEKATAAQVRVFIESSDDVSVWGTVGVSENIIQASWLALVDSISYKLIKDNKDVHEQ